ncbi:uncharacterized protein SPSK_01498 [Sporothrix schenckii 1099-18]|uniref:SprT-like domain-containing protein n=1 Tax=Sporothrix schenckii 1099-18 TaxID=1397361 RepID=A0A0F2MEX8_SPOSC|nr:uncharacterized protein SPSK_01498 [Sporothrix schenckii 1099-18]KJR87405.1 hypothetical protein SPSK_01498 [Sporothrix schenckii 1099-18]
MALRRVIIDSDDDLDDFPSLRSILRNSTVPSNAPSQTAQPAKWQAKRIITTTKPYKVEIGSSTSAPNTTIRRRKLGRINDDASLLRLQGTSNNNTLKGELNSPKLEMINLPQSSSPGLSRSKPRIELRARKTRRMSEISADDKGELSTEDATVLQDVSLDEYFGEYGAEKARAGAAINADRNGEHGDEPTGDQNVNEDSDGYSNHKGQHCRLGEGQKDDSQGEAEPTDRGQDTDSDSETSEFRDSSWSSDSSSGSLGDFFPIARTKRLANTKLQMPEEHKKRAYPTPQSQTTADTYTDDGSTIFFSAEESFSNVGPDLNASKTSLYPFKTDTAPRKLPTGSVLRPTTDERPKTPPLGHPKNSKVERLQSPSKKLPRIPQTPHQPNTDDFWNQTVTDKWNMEHSPRKLLFDPDQTKMNNQAPNGTRNAGPSTHFFPFSKRGATATKRGKDAKKLFQKNKHGMAEKFFAELDNVITGGQLNQLAASTGGVQIEWTNKLNTTAGRANWRRETLRPKVAPVVDIEDGSTTSVVSTDIATCVKHHVSIELAEKVIDDERRLYNVIAHEFCHLANFMISGITGNPHGKEFKLWAEKCSRHFGDRGIQITTKHTYEIDFKYAWTCEECSTEFKRHSKSIHPERHRCGACKGVLKQTKPVPRRTGMKDESRVGADGNVLIRGPSEYQQFMKEHMAIVRREHPNSPQKVIMTLVADKWSKAKAHKVASHSRPTADAPDNEAVAGVDVAGVDGTEAHVDHLGRALVDLTLR